MTAQPVEPDILHGPPILENWIARQSGTTKLTTYEFPLFTDARLTGEVINERWPYSFLNTVPLQNEPGSLSAHVIVRVDLHAEWERPDFSKTDVSKYHGGLLTDEIAALASLCCGVRLKAGGESRRFDLSNDPLGRPIAWDRRAFPVLSLDKNRLVLPEVVGATSLTKVQKIEQILHLSAKQSVALVRAARLYQDALWICESEPSLSWLMLVSGLETAANEWRSDPGTPSERLSVSRPEFVRDLQAIGGEDLVKKVATEIEPTLGSTKKFIDFTNTFLPHAPTSRPADIFQIAWTRQSMKKVLSKVYALRSRALHDGTPFPAPMCEPAFIPIFGQGYSERGTLGLAASAMGGVWKAEDLPISLHTFHHIVQGALLSWWDSMAVARRPN